MPWKYTRKSEMQLVPIELSPTLLTYLEVAALARVTIPTIRRAYREKRFPEPVIKNRRGFRFLKRHIVNWMRWPNHPRLWIEGSPHVPGSQPTDNEWTP